LYFASKRYGLKRNEGRFFNYKIVRWYVNPIPRAHTTHPNPAQEFCGGVVYSMGDQRGVHHFLLYRLRGGGTFIGDVRPIESDIQLRLLWWPSSSLL